MEELITDEELKEAIINNDLDFLIDNSDRYSINHVFKDEDNDSILSYSISDKDSYMYEFFLSKNPDLSLKNDLGESILHSAIYSGELKRVKRIINSINIDEKDKENTTPLLLSIGLENEVISNYLIDRGANINEIDIEGNAPIHLASFFGLKNVVVKLISKRADLNVKTSKGNLPLALAVNNNHIEVIKILCKTMYNIK